MNAKLLANSILPQNLGLMLKDNTVLTFMTVDLSTLSNVSTTLLKLFAFGCFLGFLYAVEAATPVFYDLHPFCSKLYIVTLVVILLCALHSQLFFIS